MKRNQIVLIVMLAALGLMGWSGYKNYQQRQAKARATAPVITVGAPDASEKSVAQDGQDEAEGLPNLRGKKAPAFTLKNTDGKRVSLADYKGKAVLINFWATWCAPCKVEMPWLIELQKQYGPQGFTILGISADYPKDFPDVPKYKAKNGLEYPILYGDDAVGKAYGGHGGLEYLPTTYYVGRNGKIVEETAGLASKDVIEAHIKKALAADGE